LSQKEFAYELEVSESQVSCDENNEYHGITLEKAQRILETFNVKFKAEIEEPLSKPRKDNNPLLFTLNNSLLSN